LLIPRIDFLLVEIPISHIRNTIITISRIQLLLVEMSILDIHNLIATSYNVQNNNLIAISKK